MRTNIFITNTSVAPDFVKDVDSMTTDIALIKALTNGTELEKQFNLAWVGGDSRYANLGNRESRMIPISQCELFVNKVECLISKYDDRYISFKLDIADDFDLESLIGEDITIRIILPACFNKRNSWNFSYRVKNGSTIEDLKSSIYKQVAESSIKEHIDIVKNDEDIYFYVNEKINNVYIKPLDSTPISWIKVENIPDVEEENNGNGVELITRKYLRKLILDADANYGFDYINCPSGEFYPNQLRNREVDFMLDSFVKVAEEEFGGKLGLTHITFTEPRIVETTGDVVKQVINIIHPVKDIDEFVYDGFNSMIEKLTGSNS